MNRIQKRNELSDRIQYWDQQINEDGFIEDESEIIKELQKLELTQEGNHEVASKLLTLMAISSASKGKGESLVESWLEKAIELDPLNMKANEFLNHFEWKNIDYLLQDLQFPTIREADNKQAKRRTVRQYIEICQEFLTSIEEPIESFSKLNQSNNRFK